MKQVQTRGVICCGKGAKRKMRAIEREPREGRGIRGRGVGGASLLEFHKSFWKRQQLKILKLPSLATLSHILLNSRILSLV